MVQELLTAIKSFQHHQEPSEAINSSVPSELLTAIKSFQHHQEPSEAINSSVPSEVVAIRAVSSHHQSLLAIIKHPHQHPVSSSQHPPQGRGGQWTEEM